VKQDSTGVRASTAELDCPGINPDSITHSQKHIWDRLFMSPFSQLQNEDSSRANLIRITVRNKYQHA
jgi:hypothetical protein